MMSGPERDSQAHLVWDEPRTAGVHRLSERLNGLHCRARRSEKNIKPVNDCDLNVGLGSDEETDIPFKRRVIQCIGVPVHGGRNRAAIIDFREQGIVVKCDR
jgi:hypothetical protein